MARTTRNKTTNIHDYEIDMVHYEASQRDGENDCIEWTAAKHRQGYGFISVFDTTVNKRKMMTAHRVSAMIKEDRRIPSTEMVLHDCGNMGCCNPNHLVVGDKTEMIKIMKKNGSTNAGRKFVGRIRKKK